MDHSPSKSFLAAVMLVAILLLGSCVVSKKKYEQKSAALSRMDSLYFVCQSTTRQLEEDIATLKQDTARYSEEVQELIERYNQVSQSSDKEIKQLKQEKQDLERQLEGYRITLSKYTVDWRTLKSDLMSADSVLSILSYRMDTLLSNSYLPYQILRNPSELILNLPEQQLFEGGGKIIASADTSMTKLSALIHEYPDLKITAATKRRDKLDRLEKVTTSLRLDSTIAPVDYQISPAIMEDNYAIIFTVQGHRGIFKKE